MSAHTRYQRGLPWANNKKNEEEKKMKEMTFRQTSYANKVGCFRFINSTKKLIHVIHNQVVRTHKWITV